MTDSEKLRLDVAQMRYADRKKIAYSTVSAIKECFPEGVTFSEIENILADIRNELAGGMIIYKSPLDLAQENEEVAKRYQDRIKAMTTQHMT